MPEQPLRVAVGNDYEIVVEGLAAMLGRFDDINTVELATATEEAADEPIDVALYDTFGREGMFGEQLTMLLSDPSIRHVAVFTLSWADPLTPAVIDRGVSGVLSKALDGAALAAGLRKIADGHVVVIIPDHGAGRTDGDRNWPGRSLKLTERESEVIVLLAQGLRNREIAHTLGLSDDTVKTHLKRAYRKLGVAN